MVDYGAGYGYGGGASMPAPYGRPRSPRFRRTGAQPYGAGGDTGYGGNGGATAYGAPAPQSSYYGPPSVTNRLTNPSAAAGPYEGYNTSNVFVGPGGNFSGNQGVGAVIPDFYRQGAFDPSGGGAYLDAMKADLAAQEQGDVAQAGLTSDLYGGDDPLSRMYGRLKAEQGARNRYPELIARARAEAAARREQEAYGLLSQRLGAVDYYRQPKTDYGGIAAGAGGNILGKVAGALLP